MDSALDTLAQLVEKDARAVAPFVVFVKVGPPCRHRHPSRAWPFLNQRAGGGAPNGVQGILDHLDDLNLNQVRILFHVFSTLAYSSVYASAEKRVGQGEIMQVLTDLDCLLDAQRSGATSFADEVHIVIRKQLSNANEKYKRIGVVGALAMLRTLGNRDATSAAEDDQGQEGMTQKE